MPEMSIIVIICTKCLLLDIHFFRAQLTEPTCRLASGRCRVISSVLLIFDNSIFPGPQSSAAACSDLGQVGATAGPGSQDFCNIIGC